MFARINKDFFRQFIVDLRILCDVLLKKFYLFILILFINFVLFIESYLFNNLLCWKIQAFIF